ncbi:MAG TPA: beta-ketoacyl synthase N-terminal-like domain-containing protein [Polyangiaceae bacterium]
MEPRAVTGLGVVSSIGIGREAFFHALATATVCKDRPHERVQSFDASAYPDARIDEVAGFDATKYLGDKGLRVLDRLTKMLVVSARLALHDAGLKKDNAFTGVAPERAGCVISNAYGSLEAVTELDRVAVLEDARYINPAKFPNTVSNSASGYVSIWEDLRALNVSVSDGNCGALDAVACADIYLETDRADALLVGGAEAMSEALFLAFRRFGVPIASAKASTLLGEGSALLCVEPLEKAKARGANVRALITGYGTAFVAPPGEGSLITASHESLERAIASAIEEAKIAPSDIDVVVSGMAGYPQFDDAELQAIADTIGTSVPVVAPKALVGETLGAGGALAMAAALGWMENGKPGPVVRGEAPSKVDTVLVTSMGFYGNASAVVMRRP